MNIQTKAYDTRDKKVTKKELRRFFENLYEKTSDEEEKQFLARAYRFCSDPLPKIAKNIYEWCYKATSQDKNEWLAYHNAYFDGENMVATNRYSMHMYKVHDRRDLTPGFYDRFFNKIEVDSRFVDYKRVIPNRGFESTLHIRDVENTDSGNVRVIIDNVNYILNKKLFYNIMNGESHCQVFGNELRSFNEGNCADLLGFQFKDRMAVIAPLRR